MMPIYSKICIYYVFEGHYWDSSFLLLSALLAAALDGWFYGSLELWIIFINLMEVVGLILKKIRKWFEKFLSIDAGSTPVT